MDFLNTIAPTVATMLGGPLAGIAVKFLADKLGVAEETADAVTGALTNLQGTPEGKVRLIELDNELRKHAIDAGIDLERLAVDNARDINKTMQAESAAEHWPTYSWRPAIGFAIALDLMGGVMVVLIAYSGVIFFSVKPEVLTYLPGMLGALAALIAVAAPIVGIASWFRGKAQADPRIHTNDKG